MAEVLMSSRREAMMVALTGTAALTVVAARANRSRGDAVPACGAAAPIRWAAGVEGQPKTDLGDGRYLNPILAGDYPDPLILMDGDDYYVTRSSFDASPDLLIWHSRDLVNWTPIGPALMRPIGTVFAVDLAKHQGRYFIYIPFIRRPWSIGLENAANIHVIHASSMSGPWSDPVDLGIGGLIDPGHVVGADGQRYLFLSGTNRVPLALDGLSTISPVEKVYGGWRYPDSWVTEALSLEGPKLLHRGEWFYLISAEGGTGGPPTGYMSGITNMERQFRTEKVRSRILMRRVSRGAQRKSMRSRPPAPNRSITWVRAICIVAVMALTLAFSITARAGVPGPDCPLAHEPYSTHTVLLDLLINPGTRRLLYQSGLLNSSSPASLIRTSTPSFAAIITPRDLSKFTQRPADQLDALDKQLAAIPVTPEASRARCARYDVIPPMLAVPNSHPAILVFDKIIGFRHDSVVDAGRALAEMARARGWSLVTTDNAAVFNPAQLKNFDAVVWNNVSGDVLTVSQRQAFHDYIEGGGGFVGIHASGGDPLYLWDWYADRLIGARFKGHPSDPHYQAARIIIEHSDDPIVSGLGSGWTMTEEWYSFVASPRLTGARILAKLDERTYKPVGMGGEDLRMGDHPIAWTRCIRQGRSFYTAIGHRPEAYTEADARLLLENGIAWAAGKTCKSAQ